MALSPLKSWANGAQGRSDSSNRWTCSTPFCDQLTTSTRKLSTSWTTCFVRINHFPCPFLHLLTHRPASNSWIPSLFRALFLFLAIRQSQPSTADSGSSTGHIFSFVPHFGGRLMELLILSHSSPNSNYSSYFFFIHLNYPTKLGFLKSNTDFLEKKSSCHWMRCSQSN
jgi:hypothetical protein